MILTIATNKGGTAKSSTAAALAQAAAYRGRSCLAIDLDPQANLTYFLKADATRAGAFELMQGEPATIQTTETGPDVIAASLELQTLTSSRGSARRLLTALKPFRDRYDLIIIDTPPTAGELQYNALMTSTDLIIPMLSDVVGLQGLYQMMDTARQIQKSNGALTITGYILTRYTGRSTLDRQLTQTIKERAEAMGLPFLKAIREAVALREAQARQQSLYSYAPRSKPAQDYLELFDNSLKERL